VTVHVANIPRWNGLLRVQFQVTRFGTKIVCQRHFKQQQLVPPGRGIVRGAGGTKNSLMMASRRS
jgi:hypothetical protein